jgi:hypothetical protein
MATDARRSGLLAWALALLLLAVGAAAGVAADRLLLGERDRPRGPPAPEVVLERMRRDLALTDAQAREVRGVLDERWGALGSLFERIDPEAEAIRRRADDRIRAVLEPSQRERFERQIAEQQRRRAEMRARLGRGGPAPPP